MTPTADLDVSTAAHLFADRSRSRLVRALMDGRALPAGRLAEEASVSPQTISSHLAQLLDAGFVTVEQSGRHRYYALAGPEVASAFEALGRLGTPEPVTSLREGTRAQRLRTARTCYDHLAGRYGVAVTQHLLDRQALVRDDGTAGLCRRTGDAYSSPSSPTPTLSGRPPARCSAAGASTSAGSRTGGGRRCASAWTGPSSDTTSPARSVPRC